MDFLNVFNTIKDFVMTIIDILLFLPKFVTNCISIFPTEIQIIFTTILTLICMALVYRFIK